MAAVNFDRIAPIYDLLSRLVFGRSIIDAQVHFLNRIPQGSKILILGGGTGWILSEIFEQSAGHEIWYIDSSKNMIARAKKKVESHQLVHFVVGTEDDLPAISFDVVITNFYLDLFDDATLSGAVAKVAAVLRPGGQWLAVDFVNGSAWWQRVLLRTMYVFFKITCGLPISPLPDWHQALLGSAQVQEETQNFYAGFIRSAIYRSPS